MWVYVINVAWKWVLLLCLMRSEVFLGWVWRDDLERQRYSFLHQQKTPNCLSCPSPQSLRSPVIGVCVCVCVCVRKREGERERKRERGGTCMWSGISYSWDKRNMWETLWEERLSEIRPKRLSAAPKPVLLARGQGQGFGLIKRRPPVSLPHLGNEKRNKSSGYGLCGLTTLLFTFPNPCQSLTIFKNSGTILTSGILRSPEQGHYGLFRIIPGTCVCSLES